MTDPPNFSIQESFSQFVFDNADVNVCTLDGYNTFHSMGGIQCITPPTAVSCEKKIPRLKIIPSADSVALSSQVPIQIFHKTENSGLNLVKIENLCDKNPLCEEIVPSISDFLWLFAKASESFELPGWNGYMEKITAHLPHEKSYILCLPFTNAPPSDFNTIYTVLLTAVEKTKLAKQTCCIVTFDQPLYFKARDIIASAEKGSDLSKIIVRLGGFHLLMSYLGALGFIMDGSGLKDVFNTVYAGASTDKMLTGHAYARAFRAHLLTRLALAKIIFKELNLTSDEETLLTEYLLMLEEPDYLSKIQNIEVRSLIDKFLLLMRQIEERGPTSKLWVQYFDAVTLMILFVESERSGNWTLHLQTVQKMIPFFHASGHFLYAKSCHLYLQDMLELKKEINLGEYCSFVKR